MQPQRLDCRSKLIPRPESRGLHTQTHSSNTCNHASNAILANRMRKHSHQRLGHWIANVSPTWRFQKPVVITIASEGVRRPALKQNLRFDWVDGRSPISDSVRTCVASSTFWSVRAVFHNRSGGLWRCSGRANVVSPRGGGVSPSTHRHGSSSGRAAVNSHAHPPLGHAPYPPAAKFLRSPCDAQALKKDSGDSADYTTPVEYTLEFHGILRSLMEYCRI